MNYKFQNKVEGSSHSVLYGKLEHSPDWPERNHKNINQDSQSGQRFKPGT
jgi:hypothetical protein